MGYITVSIGLQRGAVAVEAHKAEWEAAAKKTIELLKSILKNDAVDIRHVGSTAVKSICAKPIIDIAVGVRNFDDIFAHNGELQKHGIDYRARIIRASIYMFARMIKIIFKRIIFILLFITAKIGIIM